MSTSSARILTVVPVLFAVVLLTGLKITSGQSSQTAKPTNLMQALQQYQNKEIVYNELGQVRPGTALLSEVGDDYIKLELRGNFKGVLYVPTANIQSVLHLKGEVAQLYFR